jgi:DNA-binding NarL/FixJ family response regulator
MPPSGTYAEDKSLRHPAFVAGRRALLDADWAAACEHFRAVVAEYPDAAEAWEGLATASYWIPDEDTIFEARERAYHLYRERGDKPSAARMAGWLAVDTCEMRGQGAIANGWMQRAQRLLEGQGETPDSAWVAVLQSRLLVVTGEDAGRVSRAAARAAALARRVGLADVEALALSTEGHARLDLADIRRAVLRLDEAAAIALGGEATDITARALTLCQLMGACERTRDFDRARQWCAAARQFSEDRGFPVILSICRPHYGAVLMWRGQWHEAEEHLLIGVRDLVEFMPPFAVGAQALLGALRWRQGRWEEAAEMFEQVRHEPPAQTGMAELMASEGDVEGAIDVLERHLRGVPAANKLERGPALELLVRYLAATGETRRAADPLRELQEIATSVRTPSLRAAAAFAEGVLAAATSDFNAAQACLDDAVELFERAGAPFESARSRLALAEALRDRGRLDASAREAQVAQETMLRIGAAKEADRAGRLLAVINAQRSVATQRSPDGLTARESEILTLLAQGRSNQEIAASLVLSVRTVERHISNIYEKLGLEGRTARTAAAAHAHRLREEARPAFTVRDDRR